MEPAKVRVPCITAACTMRCHSGGHMTRTICLAVWYVCAKPCVVEVEPAKLRVPCITAACTMRCHNEHSLGRACTNPHDSLPGCLVCMRVPPSVIAAGRMQRTVGRGPANRVGELEVGGHKHIIRWLCITIAHTLRPRHNRHTQL